MSKKDNPSVACGDRSISALGYCTREPEKTEAQRSKKGRDEGYKGFLHLQCEYCGTAHTFCAKHPMQVYKCSACGELTALRDLVRMEQVCECGNRSRYRTNAREDMFDVDCVCCGTPVAMEWHEGLRRYMPCDMEPPVRKNKRRRGK